MTDYLLRNSLNPNKVARCTITFRQLVDKGEEGELTWLVEIRTTEPSKNGGEIPPVYIQHSSSNNLDDAIREATEQIAKQIDWSPLSDDLRPPFIEYSFPNNINDIVGIYSKLIVDIVDILPAAGIDPASIEVTVNDIDVTEDIELIGDPYSYRVIWEPKERVLNYY